MSYGLFNQDTKLCNIDNGDNNSDHCVLGLITNTKTIMFIMMLRYQS